MANFWDILADKTGDTSIGDTKGLIDKAGNDQKTDDDGKTNTEWGNSPSHDSGSGHSVADKGDWGNSSDCNYSR